MPLSLRTYSLNRCSDVFCYVISPLSFDKLTPWMFRSNFRWDASARLSKINNLTLIVCLFLLQIITATACRALNNLRKVFAISFQLVMSKLCKCFNVEWIALYSCVILLKFASPIFLQPHILFRRFSLFARNEHNTKPASATNSHWRAHYLCNS